MISPLKSNVFADRLQPAGWQASLHSDGIGLWWLEGRWTEDGASNMVPDVSSVQNLIYTWFIVVDSVNIVINTRYIVIYSVQNLWFIILGDYITQYIQDSNNPIEQSL